MGQNVQCADCHAGHVAYDANASTEQERLPNVFLIRRYMNISSSAGAVRNGRVFFQYTGSVRNYVDFSGTGVCQGCHPVPQGEGYPPEHSSIEANVCASCHGHQSATGSFSASCSSCHGYPPPAAASGYAGVDETTSPHRRHAGGGVNYQYSCNQCHKGNRHNTGTFQDLFRDRTGILAGASASYDPATRTCSNIACHGDGTSVATGVPAANTIIWGSNKPGCSGCHGNPPAYSSGTPKTNSHQRHGFGCNSCHNATTTDGTTITGIANHLNRAYNVDPGGGAAFSYAFNTAGGSCSAISCHGTTSAKWGSTACLGCHSTVQGTRAAITGQFGGSSHHVQGELTDAKCYQCHWEANSDGTINSAYHGGAAAPGSPVDLVIYGAAARPATFTAGATAVQYTANGTRTEIEKVTSHCLGCHSDQNNSTTPFGDGKTPKQYAWDGTSVAARYAQTGKTTWGKYSTVTNAAQKRIAKSLSAHGNAAANQRGWDTSNGVDGAIANTSGGTGVQCYDCHNSHGSSVAGVTSRYSSATGNKRGGLLKETVTGVGGYATTYKPQAGGSTADKNVRNPGASICLDCHLNQTATTTPWGYSSTYGATQAILGYRDAPMYKDYSTSGTEQRYPFKKKSFVKGGHFGASSPLSSSPMGSIDGLCTPCHDPHGVSPTLGADQQYAVPLLKGTWLTSPYKEDTAPANNTNFTNRKDIGREGVPYNIDQNTFGSSIKDAVTGISQTESQTEGLCIGCHSKESLTDGVTHTWKSKSRIHESVKGWKTANGTIQHNYSCSKCHSPHDSSSLPRLMVTNCLDSKHKGRTGNNASPVLSDNGWKTYGGACSGAAAEFGDWGWCLSRAGSGAFGGSGSGRFPGSWGGSKPGFQGYGVACHEGNSSDQQWNELTPWAVNPSAPPAPPVIGQPVAISASSVRWNYTDTANDNDGFHLHDAGNTLKASNANAKSTYVVESGLTANTRYTRHLHAYNAAGDSLPSGDASIYTLPQAASNVTADKQNIVWSSIPGVTFTNSAGFGPGGVEYYRYVWTQDWPYTFTGNETIWNGGTLTTTATADGVWYLHVKSYNGDDVGINDYTGTYAYGPYKYDSTAPTVSTPSPGNGGTGAITNPLMFTIADPGSGIDWGTITIQINGSMGYAKSYTAADTAIVTNAGSPASYSVKVKPDAPYGNGEVITWSFSVKDMVGHELVSPVWNFTASNTVVAAPTLRSADSYYYSTMRWAFTDNSDNETGFRLHDPTHLVKTTTGPSAYFVDESGLTANTQYTRHLHAYNANGESEPSQSISRYTLALAPDVVSDKLVSMWGNAPVTFTNNAGFGTGKVEYYRYAWDKTATHSFAGTDPIWGSGSLTLTPESDGNWYLHVLSYNKDDVSYQYYPAKNYGPYFYDATPPTGLAVASPPNAATDVPVNTVLSSTVATDSSSGSVQYLFQIAKDIGFTIGVQSSGWQTGTNYSPLLDGGTTYYWRVKARDRILNETPYTAPARSFTTLNIPFSRVTWTTKGDFETNTSTTGSLTSRNQVLISGTNQTDNADVTLTSKKWKNPTTAAGYSHALALKLDGSVWAWGNNYYGQVGDGTSGNGTDKPTPVQVSGLGVGSGVIAVSATYNSSLALKGDGSVWAWGDNTYGQLGDGTGGYGIYKSTPVQVSGLGAGSGVIAISAGEKHFLALKSDGTVWAWGDNSYAQLGDGTSTLRSVPVIVSGLTGGVAIASGKIHSLAVKADGSVWSWGYNGTGALGDGSNTSKLSPVQVSTMGTGSGVIALTGGYFHTLAIKVDGSVWAWGSNLKGQLGIVSGNTNSPIQVMAPGSGASAVAAARQSSFLLKDDGSVLAWGLNDYGQLGDGTTTNRTTPVPVSGLGANPGSIALSAGEFISQSLNADGALSAWGYSQSGAIVGGTNGANNTPVPNTLISGIQMPLSYNSLYLYPGTVTGFKQDAGFRATWGGIYWNGSVPPPDTSIKYRTRGADTEAGLDSAAWSDYYLTSGAGITTAASQWLEVELTLQTGNQYSAPVLADFTVTYFP